MKSVVRFKMAGPMTCPLIGILLLMLSGCALFSKRPISVRAGDSVAISCNCRTENGEWIATTDSDAARQRSQLWRDVILLDGELVASVEKDAANNPQGEAGSPAYTKDVIETALSQHLLQMGYGENRTVAIEAEASIPLDRGERFLEMSRIQKRPLKKTIGIERFQSISGTDSPAIGMSVGLEKGLERAVAAFDESSVTLQLKIKDGDIVDTVLGKGRVTIDNDLANIRILAQVGDMVTLGPHLGHVSSINNERITLDFGHPLGGKRILCNMTAEGRVPPHAASQHRSGNQQTILAQPMQRPAMPESPQKAAASATAAAKAAEVLTDQVQKDDVVRVSVGFSGDSDAYPAMGMHDDLNRLSTTVGSGLKIRHEEVIAGVRSTIPGIADAIVGMKIGQEMVVTIPPEKAFGVIDDANILTFPCIRRLNRKMTYGTQQFIDQFGKFPIMNDSVDLAPYFKSRVSEVNADEVTVTLLAENGSISEDPFGQTRVSVVGNDILIRLSPKIGGKFLLDGRQGRIVSSNGSHFVVDFNHPLAGKSLTVDVKILEIEKSSTLSNKQIHWVDDYSEAIALSESADKPMVLVLYAAWCPWSKRYFSETLKDPRVKKIKDFFVWARVNSDVENGIKEMFDQTDFPMTLIMNQDGTIVKRLDGFQSPEILMTALKVAIEQEAGS